MRQSNLTSFFHRYIPPRTVHLVGRTSFSRKMSSKTYDDAIDKLNSLQTNAAALELVRATGGRSSALAIPEMLEYLERSGYTQENLNDLNVIHITGTKGKGSTSAFTDSILRHAKPDWKVGLYTSPHLIAVRERIRINGSPLSEAEFVKYFYELWDRLEKNDTRKSADTPLMPGYFRFMTLLAFHVFKELKVDATVLEVGVGGTYDSTNIVPKPVVTGITALGIDHVNVLGSTIKEIAWQKGGIYKEGVPALTVNQPPEGLDMLEMRARELKASEFTVISTIPELSDIPLGLAGVHQRQNASLAVCLARRFLELKADFHNDATSLPPSFIDGLKNTKWPGRCQTVADPQRINTTWYLDGAHTRESLDCCIEWFASKGVGLEQSGTQPSTRVLIFNCTKGRTGQTFLNALHTKTAAQLKLNGIQGDADSFFDHVIFCTNVTYADGHFKSDLNAKAISTADPADLTKTQEQLAEAWSALVPSFPPSHIHVLPSIQHAITVVDEQLSGSSVSSSIKILVTCSLHLVGGVIEVAGLSDVAL